jgi:hypothetical protein
LCNNIVSLKKCLDDKRKNSFTISTVNVRSTCSLVEFLSSRRHSPKRVYSPCLSSIVSVSLTNTWARSLVRSHSLSRNRKTIGRSLVLLSSFTCSWYRFAAVLVVVVVRLLSIDSVSAHVSIRRVHSISCLFVRFLSCLCVYAYSSMFIRCLTIDIHSASWKHGSWEPEKSKANIVPFGDTSKLMDSSSDSTQAIGLDHYERESEWTAHLYRRILSKCTH